MLELLRREYDVEYWWPSGSPFEVMVGALLIQQTNWESVDKVLARLRSEGLLEVDSMASCEPSRLESIIRPAGFYRQKAKRIRGLAAYLRDRHGSDPRSLLGGPTESVRRELLSLEGIGGETADSILVFAAGRAKFVAAAYSVRILSRTGVFRSQDYDEVQRFVESRMPGDARGLRDLYALIVEHAREVCRAVPACDRCSLAPECAYFNGKAGR